jgi:hypothetical protein
MSPTVFAAEVIAPGFVRTRVGEHRCDAALNMRTGARLEVTLHSEASGEQAIPVGAGLGPWDLSGLEGRPWQ